MNIRQQKYKQFRLEGYSKYTSARKAGYAHNTAIKAKQVENSINMDYWLEEAGLTDTCLANHAKEGLNANKVISANIIYGEADSKTNDFIDVPDWNSRHKYLETVLKLRNKLETKSLIDQSQHFTNIYKEVRIVVDRNSDISLARRTGDSIRERQ